MNLRIYRIGKRTFDVFMSLAIAVVVSPVLILVAALVRWRLGAPVIFRQERAGLMGKPFNIFKFRTMSQRTDQYGKLHSDENRITRLGRFLRMASLDELPQIFNVLRGEMSLVGPRPLYVHYIPRYSQTQRRRLQVRPGITGLAQVMGRNNLPWEERLSLDVQYVDTASFLLDLRILGLTFIRVVRRTGISQDGHATMTEFIGHPGDQPHE